VRVLVVDDEIRNAELTALSLREAGHEVDYVGGGQEALDRQEANPYDVLVTDLRMKPPDGMAVLTRIRQGWPRTSVVLMTAYADQSTARAAFKLGVKDYVHKDGDFHAELREIITGIAEQNALRGENRTLRELTAAVIGDSPRTRQALELAQKVAVTDSTVLLRGESGTGKDLFARTIHFASRRAGGPWIKVNCGALPENLLESELFGHEKGAFTGAVRQKAGRFEDAHKGTIFLDEIGELPPSLQVKLLQVIEERVFMRVGGNQPVKVDVRIVTATNRDLEDMVKARGFREDLFFRLNVFPITLPPLRERPGDVPALARFFLERHGAPADKVRPAAMQALERYAWPGNVRELEYTLERALILAGADPIGVEHLSFARPELMGGAMSGAGAPAWVPRIPPEGLSLEVLERELILQSLELARGNKSAAARLLGLTRRTLYSRMERHGLRTPGEAGEDAGEDDAADAAAGGAERDRT
jgi:DNA-binding NtrC family response regulator